MVNLNVAKELFKINLQTIACMPILYPHMLMVTQKVQGLDQLVTESFTAHQSQTPTHALPEKLTHANSWRKELSAITKTWQKKKSKYRGKKKGRTLST